MSKRNGNPKHSSNFICLRCLKENQVGDGIPRTKTKEKGHVNYHEAKDFVASIK